MSEYKCESERCFRKDVLGKLYLRYADKLEGRLRALDVEAKPAKFLESLIKYHKITMSG